ncbi:MAG: SpoIIIAH-like family protein [Bacillota bacterium]|jgi:DNA-binding protein
MLVRAKSLIAAILILVALGVGGHMLVNYYIDQQLVWNPAAKVTPGDPGLMPGQPPVSIEPSRDFFAEHRLEREKQRSMQVELLREIINNVNTSPEVRTKAQQEWLSLTALMEQELTVEKLVMSKGFDDAILVFNQDTANVIVRAQGLTSAEALQVMELVATSLGVKTEQVRVIERDA